MPEETFTGVEDQLADRGAETPESNEVNLADIRLEDTAARSQSKEKEGDDAGKDANSKRGVQRRIDKLTREKGELEKRLRAAESGQRPAGKPEGQRQFESIEEFSARIIRGAAERERTAAGAAAGEQQADKPGEKSTLTPEQQEQQRQHDQLQQGQLARAKSYAQRLEAATKDDAEFHQEVKRSTEAGEQMPVLAMHQALINLPNGHEVTRYLAKNRDVRQRLTGLFLTYGNAVYEATGNPNAALQAANTALWREMHKISNALEYGTAFPSAPRQEQTIKRPVSAAPAPISPVGGSAGVTTSDEDDENSNNVDLAKLRKRTRRDPRRGS